MNALEKLRTAARNMAKGRNLENHEECNLLLVIADEIEAEVAESYMPVPKDADGEPIHLGDLLRDSYGDEHICHGIGKPSLDVMDEHCKWWRSDALRHVKPDPLKELLEELACDVRKEWVENAPLADHVFAEYADRIRELTGGAE